MDRDVALTRIRHAAVAGLISGGLGLLLVTIALRTDADALRAFADPANYADGVLMVLLAGLLWWRGSRTAAVLMFLSYLLGLIVAYVDGTRSLTSVPVALLVLYFLWGGIRGSFALRRLQRAENPDFRAAPRWLYWTGGGALVLFLGLVVMGLTIDDEPAVQQRLLSGSALAKEDVWRLRELGALAEREVPELFYSAGTHSIFEDGNLLTRQRVISYYGDADAIEAVSAEYGEIAALELVHESEDEDAGVLRVRTRDERAFLLYLPPLPNEAAQFVRAIAFRAGIEPVAVIETLSSAEGETDGEGAGSP